MPNLKYHARRKELNERRHSALKEDWLAGNAVVAFVGVLLIAQSWNLSDGVYKLPFNVTIPAFHDAVYLAFGALLFASSFALALASQMPRLRHRVISASKPFSVLMGLLIWVAFIVSWLGAIAELPFNRWWSMVLYFGGFTFFLFLGYRLIRTWFQLMCQLQTGPEER